MRDTPYNIQIFNGDTAITEKVLAKSSRNKEAIETAAKSLKPEYRMVVMGMRSIMGERPANSTQMVWNENERDL